MFEHFLTSLFSLLIPSELSKGTPNIPVNIVSVSEKKQTKDFKNINIKAESALLIDIESGETLFHKNADDKRSPASLTKLLGALVILKNEDLNKIYIVPSDIHEINGSKNHFVPGQKVKVRDLVAISLIESSNQAIYTLAINFSGSESKFVNEMNKLAKILGMENSNFVNSTGFDDEKQYSTASDLRKLALYSIRHPLMYSVTKEKEKNIKLANGKKYTIEATNKLLWSKIPGFLTIEGLKTGTTPEAGQCLITTATTEKGETILAIILGSDDRYSDAKKLFTYAKQLVE